MLCGISISGLKHPGLETFFKNTGEAIKHNQGSPSVVVHSKPGSTTMSSSTTPSKWYSIFPVDNDDLVNSKWEDKIIWDSEVRFTCYCQLHETYL